jgi:hypothetical protein
VIARLLYAGGELGQVLAKIPRQAVVRCAYIHPHFSGAAAHSNLYVPVGRVHLKLNFPNDAGALERRLGSRLRRG